MSVVENDHSVQLLAHIQVRVGSAASVLSLGYFPARNARSTAISRFGGGRVAPYRIASAFLDGRHPRRRLAINPNGRTVPPAMGRFHAILTVE